ncbi:MAG: hypothetical protein ACKO2H_11420, partial [Bacteroidota bacterium]
MLFSFLLAIICSFSATAQQAIKAGPMVTHADMRQVTIWLQMSSECNVSIQYAPIGQSSLSKKTKVYHADQQD